MYFYIIVTEMKETFLKLILRTIDIIETKYCIRETNRTQILIETQTSMCLSTTPQRSSIEEFPEEKRFTFK